MVWRHPTYLWAEIVPAVVLLAWAVAERRRKRRLEAFGDAGVMGLSLPWLPRAAGVFFLIMGLASAAALMPLPAYESEEKGAVTPVTRLLIDVRSMDFEDDRIWQSMEDAVREVLQQTSGLYHSVVIPGRPLETWIPATEDGNGLQMLLTRLRLEIQRDAHPQLAEIIHAAAGSSRPAATCCNLVIFTALPAAEIENLLVESPVSTMDLLFVSLAKGGDPVQFGRRSGEAGWTWTTRSESFRVSAGETLQRENQAQRNFSTLQQLASLAFLLFTLEFICSLAARSTRTGERFA